MAGNQARAIGWLLRGLAAAVILAGGIGAQRFLAAHRQPPPRIELEELPLSVDVASLHYRDTTVELIGLGTVRSATRLAIAPEVGGKLLDLHPRLEAGSIVAAGDLLVQIDPVPFQLAREARAAELDVIRAQLAEVASDLEGTAALLDLRRQTLAANLRVLERARTLLENRAGTQADVDRAEQAWLQLREQVTQLENTALKLPVVRETLEARALQVNRQLALDDLNLARCRLVAPFGGRLETVHAERGQLVAPGQVLCVLVDDLDREVAVSLDGRETSRWLRFLPGGEAASGWFAPVEPVPVTIEWVGGQGTDRNAAPPVWVGRLERLEEFDEQTRTIHAVVSIPPAAGAAALVPGMFCRARIPGRTLPGIARLPRTAVNDDRTVFIVRDGRLASAPVEIVHAAGDDVLVAGNGLAEGTPVVINRLSAPLLGIRVAIRNGHAAP